MRFDSRAAIASARRDFRLPPPCVLDGWGWFLCGMAGNVTSQNGEDGLIAALLDKVGALNRWCFEVGAADGLALSNTFCLRADGWDSVMIEADDQNFARLASYKNDHCRVVHERIGPDSLDRILREACAPANLDLGVIDVDGIDAEVWRGLKAFRPRVMLVEFNALGDGVLPGGEWQAGLDTLSGIGVSKGYRLVARTTYNAIFVDESVVRENP